jgi:uncharacterized protein (DUF2249 family)
LLVAGWRHLRTVPRVRQVLETAAQGDSAMPASTAASTPDSIDVRSLIPMQRHQKIFELVGQLAPGRGFVLINDHDPKPLYYQLEAEHPGQFSWTYLESGPEVWRVEIARKLKAA